VTEATTDDAEAISTFFWDAWREAGPDAPGWAGASPEVVAEIASPESIAARVGGPARRMFLAWHDDRVVGFAATRRIDDDSIELAGVIVLASLTGRGVGTPLVEAAVRAATSLGYTRMLVSTEADNERALGFYEARGFARTGTETRDVEGVEIDLAMLERSLE
jgi:ribosomal protein S18 acetylase RimI-like enzyme